MILKTFDEILARLVKDHPNKYASFPAFVENESSVDVYELVCKANEEYASFNNSKKGLVTMPCDKELFIESEKFAAEHIRPMDLPINERPNIKMAAMAGWLNGAKTIRELWRQSIEKNSNLTEEYLELLASDFFEHKMDKAEGFDVKHGWKKMFRESIRFYESTIKLTEDKEKEATEFAQWAGERYTPFYNTMDGHYWVCDSTQVKYKIKELYSLYKSQKK